MEYMDIIGCEDHRNWREFTPEQKFHLTHWIRTFVQDKGTINKDGTTDSMVLLQLSDPKGNLFVAGVSFEMLEFVYDSVKKMRDQLQLTGRLPNDPPFKSPNDPPFKSQINSANPDLN